VPTVVSNTGPLIALAEIGQLGLLQRLFTTTLIPPTVRAEILIEPTLSALQSAISDEWISVQEPDDTGAIRLLNETLDRGESEAIALAQRTATEWVILDDLAARHVAEAMGLPVIGTLGVLLLAKEAGYVAQVKPLLDKLRERRFYISEMLYASILTSAGESD
jgi:predicted nucleic acid-binding protein